MSKLYTEKEVAEMLSISVYTLQEWRHKGYRHGIPYLKIGRSVRYEHREIMKYLERRRIA